MKSLTALILLWAVLAASAFQHFQNDDIIEAVNKAETTWKAGRNFDSVMPIHYVSRLLGLKTKERDSILPRKTAADYEHIMDATVPKEFDARKEWPKCHGIKTLRDQGDCGSCWRGKIIVVGDEKGFIPNTLPIFKTEKKAVSTAATFSDRLCIASKGKFDRQLSSQDLISCCGTCGAGCFGGYDDEAWMFFQDVGIVTGGDYGTKGGCRPYEKAPCEHNVNGTRPHCAEYGPPITPDCIQKCKKSYKKRYNKDHYKVSATFTLNDPVAIQKEIMTNGPLEAGYKVYADFLNYKSGVYHYVTGDVLGGHAVKIIGWGEENNTPYWLVANSWNSDWGDSIVKSFTRVVPGPKSYHPTLGPHGRGVYK